MDRITEEIWIGNFSEANDRAALQASGIRSILCLDGCLSGKTAQELNVDRVEVVPLIDGSGNRPEAFFFTGSCDFETNEIEAFAGIGPLPCRPEPIGSRRLQISDARGSDQPRLCDEKNHLEAKSGNSSRASGSPRFLTQPGRCKILTKS